MLLGYLFGFMAMPFMNERRKVIHANLKACFPEKTALWRFLVAFGHQAMLGRFVLDHALLLAAGKKRLMRLVDAEGMGIFDSLGDRSVIIISPHTIGIDHGGVRFSMENSVASFYTPQKNKMAERLILRCRCRLVKKLCLISSMHNTILQATKILKAGGTLYYLGDVEKSHRSKCLFIPFLGKEKVATITTLPRLAKITGAVVVPSVTVAKPLGGYRLSFGQPWENFPSGDDESDMRRFNDFIGEVAKSHPTQYYWPHRRFKVTAENEEDVYA